MIRLDEDALICDFAETYHIFDYRSISATMAARLAVGLRENSRIKLLASDRKASIDTVLLAGIMDRLSVLLGGEKAKLIAKNFVSSQQAEEEAYGYETPEDFDSAWAAMVTNNE